MQTTQDAPAEFLIKLWPWLEANKNRLLGGVAVIVVVVGIYYFLSYQRQEKEIAAGDALTQLLVAAPASATAVQTADSLAQLGVTYSGTAAGQRAQLQAAAAYFELGRYPDAQTQFQKYLDASPDGPLASTAELGVAASLEAQSKLTDAAAAYQKVTFRFPGTPGALSAEFALGRIAENQGKLAEAETHYETVARTGNVGGSLAQEAAMHYTQIKARLASEQKTAAPAKPAIPAAPATPVPFQISK